MTGVGQKTDEDVENWTSRSIYLPVLGEFRQSRRLSQRELGRLAEVSADSLNRLETSKREAPCFTVRKFTETLGVSPAKLAPEHHPSGHKRRRAAPRPAREPSFLESTDKINLERQGPNEGF